MVAQVLANSLELVANLDTDAFEQLRPADAGQFQKLRRIDRTGADDDLPVGAGFVLLAVDLVAHADAALAFDQQAFGQRIGLDRSGLAAVAPDPNSKRRCSSDDHRGSSSGSCRYRPAWRRY